MTPHFPSYPRLLLVSCLLALALPLSSQAGDPHVVEVIKDGDTISLRLPILEGTSGKEATEILTSDLERSGWFKLVASGGDFVVQGSATSSSVNCKLLQKDGVNLLSPSGTGDLRRATHQVANQIIEKLTGKKGFALSKIAFFSDKSGKKELYVMDYDGMNVKKFTSDKSIAGSPNFSSQGDRIAFTSYASGYPDSYIMNYPGGDRRRVAGFPGLNSGASFSPDGSKIAITLSKDGNPELYTMSVGGGNLKRLTRTRGGESSPSWSPNGDEIAFASDVGGRPQIYVVSSSGGVPTRITSSPAYNTKPDWSKASGKIAYCSLRGSDFSISVMDSKDGGGRVVYSDGSCEDPSWAPDGRHLVFSKTVNYKTELYILDTITKEAIQLTRNFGNCTEPAWSGK